MKPTIEQISALLRYDPATGQFWWRDPGPGRRVGRPAGWVDPQRGYVSIIVKIDGERHYLYGHRLAWLFMKGEWPPDDLSVDHRNCDGSDNRWVNLRLATAEQQQGNKRAYKGLKGVRRKPSGKYEAYIVHHRKQRYLGTHDTPEAAHRAYLDAAEDKFGAFARSA